MGQGNVKHDLMPIGAVVNALRHDYPDVSHSSLRFLEREGLIVPTRTAGGHRLYTPADIQRVRQIKDWQAQRFSIEEIRQRLAELAMVGAPDVLAGQFLEHALAGDLESARRTILTASDLGLSLDVIFGSVLRPALWELGERWASGTVSVAQEKEVSEVARDLIAELGQRAAVPSGNASGVVAACVAGERHELGLRMVSGLLRARGLGVHFLGADVDPAFLLDAVERRRPRAVLLSATSDEQLPAVQAAANALREIRPMPQLLAGGQAIERQSDTVAGWGVTTLRLNDLKQLDELANSLLAAAEDDTGS